MPSRAGARGGGPDVSWTAPASRSSPPGRRPGATAPAWKVAGSAALTLGGVAGDSALDFVGIVGAKRLADGSLVVANGGTGRTALVLG